MTLRLPGIERTNQSRDIRPRPTPNDIAFKFTQCVNRGGASNHAIVIGRGCLDRFPSIVLEGVAQKEYKRTDAAMLVGPGQAGSDVTRHNAPESDSHRWIEPDDRVSAMQQLIGPP